MVGLGFLPRNRWLGAALVASLMLNGFLIGMIVTDSLRSHGRRAGTSPRIIGYELRQIAERLEMSDVERIRAELETLTPALGDRLGRLRQTRAEIYALAAEPSPDRPLIDARLADLRREVAAMQESVQKATFDALLRLPPDSRQRLAEAAPPR